jgi:KipI family sensor histidine kinase inhibitor
VVSWFSAGIPYLAGCRALAMPRRAEPRVRVPAGSVGIGGAQTGIYPLATPGGWQLLGRTALALFDPARKSLCCCAWAIAFALCRKRRVC